MTDPVWSVIILIGLGLIFAAYIIYDILRLAYSEIKNETTINSSINDESSH